MTEAHSYRQILRSSSIIGGASVVNILVGLLRAKAVALILGPAGVGLFGLFTNIVATASTLSGLGFGNVGTRQIAEASANEDPIRVAAARRALFWGTMALAALGGAMFWLLRGVIARHILGDAHLAGEIGWLAIAVSLTVAAASQNALLNGLRRIGDIARVSMGSALLSTCIGVVALLWFGRAGLALFVIVIPAASFLLGHLFVARLPRVAQQRTELASLAAQWRVLATLGAAFMIAGLAGTVGQLVVRSMFQHELGVEALGHFQASWAISMTYIGFVLSAMGTDYYPRLTAVIGDHDAANRLVNQQTEVALLLATPVLLAMLGLAPWIIRLLYSSAFLEAADMLRWQVLGDFLKVMSWPLGFILLASGAGRTFMFTEWTAAGLFVALCALTLPVLGVQSAGISFLGMYAGYLPLVYWFAARRTGFRYSAAVIRLIGLGMGAGLAILFLSRQSTVAAATLGVLSSGIFGIGGLIRLAAMADAGGRAGKISNGALRILHSIGLKNDPRPK